MQGIIKGSGNYVFFKDGSKLADNLANYNSGIVLYQKQNFDLNKLGEYLEKIDIKARLEWFKLNFPRADIVKIEAAQMADKLNNEMKDKIDPNVAVSIESATNLTWKQ